MFKLWFVNTRWQGFVIVSKTWVLKKAGVEQSANTNKKKISKGKVSAKRLSETLSQNSDRIITRYG